MRVLHVLDHSLPLHSGYVFRTCAILREQKALGWSTIQVTSSKQGASPSPIEEVGGFAFYRTANELGFSARVPVLNQMGVVYSLEQRLREVIALERPDVIHAHSPALNGLAALRAGRAASLPVVYECRAFWEDAAVSHGTGRDGGLRYRLSRALETKVFHKADAITTICEGLKSDIVKRGIEAERVTIIPNAIDPYFFSARRNFETQLRQQLGLNGKTVIGFIGSFYRYEGLHLLLQALPQLTRQHPEVHALLVGGGQETAQLQSLSKALGVADAVTFTGRVPHEDVARYYDLVDVFAYPRVPIPLCERVTPLKPLEAMASGRLVVASDVGGHRELIEDGKTGYLFPANDASALAQRLSDVISSRDTWPQILQSARSLVTRDRTWRQSVQRYITVYESLVANERAA